MSTKTSKTAARVAAVLAAAVLSVSALASAVAAPGAGEPAAGPSSSVRVGAMAADAGINLPGGQTQPGIAEAAADAYEPAGVSSRAPHPGDLSAVPLPRFALALPVEAAPVSVPLPRTGCSMLLVPSTRTWEAEIRAAVAETGSRADVAALVAVAKVESVGDPNAQSVACARGLFQIMPDIWDSYIESLRRRGLPAEGLSIWDPEDNIRAALWLWAAIGEWRGWRCWWGAVGERPADLGDPRCDPPPEG